MCLMDSNYQAPANQDCDFVNMFEEHDFEEIHNQHSMTILGDSIKNCNESILKIDIKEHVENKCKLGIYKL